MLIVVAVIGLLLIIFGYFLKKSFAEGAVRKAKYLQTKSDYESLLKKLEADPGNNQVRVQALETGRKYYGYLHPDLVRFVNNVPVDNGADTSIIETKVQSDLQARIKKG